MSIMQDGFGLPIFPLPLYQYIVHGDISAIAITDENIPDPGLKQLICMVSLFAKFCLTHLQCCLSPRAHKEKRVPVV